MNRSSFGAFAPASGGTWGADPGVPGGPGFIALLEAFRATGGTVPGEIVGRLLEEHQVGNAISLAKLVHTGQVFGFEWRASLWIPMFQFDADDLALNAAAQRVRAALPSLWSGWTVATWFAAPNAGLGGRSPADMLACDPGAALRAAQSLQAAAGFALAPAQRGHRGDRQRGHAGTAA